MARGVTRAPSQNAYRGALGRTQTSVVHVAIQSGDLAALEVHTTIDAVSDPELADRLRSDDPARGLNVFRIAGHEPMRVGVPVLYHDPAAEVMVLVLDDTCAHRELDERIRVLERLRADAATIPAYVKELAVVYGAAGLRAHLESQAAREVELERMRIDTERRARELDRRATELEVARAEVERIRAELARDRVEIDRLRSEARNRVIATAQQANGNEGFDLTSISGPPEPRDTEIPTRPITKAAIDDLEANLSVHGTTNGRSEDSFVDDLKTGVVDALAIEDAGDLEEHAVDGDEVVVEFDEETTGTTEMPLGSDPLLTETVDLPLDVANDAWFEQAASHPVSTLGVFNNGSGGTVRLALVVGEQLARGFGGNLDVRVLLHRAPSYPVVALVFGPPAALRGPGANQLATVIVDIAADHDRQVLVALVKRFELVVDLVVRGKKIRRVKLGAPLGENVGYILRGAEDHLRAVAAEGEPDQARARELVMGAGHDLLGTQHPDAGEFRDDKLSQLDTAQHLRRALAMARRFARPSREDYLVCTRGFPLPRWRELRRQVLEAAVNWGIWMGPELAQVAVSEGLARSRRDLIARLDRGFDVLRRHPTANDIDDEAAEDNANAIAEEARALGVELRRSSTGGAIASDEVSSVSGSIGGNTPARGIKQPPTVDALMAQLDDRQHRVAAALELCDRGEGKAAAKVIGAVTKMSRAEAVRVLGMSVKFGDAAKAPLLDGLGSTKAFLRHGCALALALLRTEDGTQAVIDLLLTEPTEIWREVARAIGQVGPTALLPLASTFGRLGEHATPSMAERVAWAMAHVAVRGGKAAIETMAGGQSVVAPVARHALDLLASAANDQVRVRPSPNGSQPGREVTVNRAFSRRFFEAVEAGLPDAGQAGLVDLEASSPMEMLDESDLIEDDDESELDESDLIQ